MKTKFLLLVIFLLAIVLRFYKLGEAPKGFYLDEAAIGYNAFSILKTGKDEFGYPLPWIFRSFVDFKAPIYSYLMVPLLLFWDLSVFATRFPSAFLGVLTIPLVYLLIKETAPKEIANKIALATCMMMSISPWHIIFSRTTYETNIALFFFSSSNIVIL